MIQRRIVQGRRTVDMIDAGEAVVETVVRQVEEGEVSGSVGKPAPHKHDIVQRLTDCNRALAMAIAVMMDIISDRAAHWTADISASAMSGSGMSHGIGGRARSASRQAVTPILALVKSRQPARFSQWEKAGTIGISALAAQSIQRCMSAAIPPLARPAVREEARVNTAFGWTSLPPA